MKNNTINYFEQIMQVPRQSGNEQKIVNYLVNFAKVNNFEYFLDNYKNVIIYKNKSSNKKIILQAHTDMVCVSDKDFDFENSALTKTVNGDFLSAKNTSLGADNRIGVAVIMSLLLEDLPVGIEAVFTSEEETTMFGASKIDFSKLQATKLLSFDGDRNDVIEISSAGFKTIKVCFNTKKTTKTGHKYKIRFSNFTGGHSGVDIDKNRINAILFASKFMMKTIKMLYQ
ncbi:MAG: hypothetical protein IJE45_04230 [Bacilli bacterium]|nr:hypothetical protein [Bacilli bacterium]